MSELPLASAQSEDETIAEAIDPVPTSTPTSEIAASPEPKPSYVKLAMRNMVRKGGKSLFHFGLTTTGLLGILVGLAYLTR